MDDEAPISPANKLVAAGPVSRILSALRRDGHSSGPRITARLKRPTRRLWRAEPARVPGKAEASLGNPSLFGLAPCGVCPARRITASAVRSYRTFSPLPEPCGPAVCFLWHFPSSDPAHKSAGALPDVIRHTALRSSDFPPVLRRATVRSGCQPVHYSADRWCGQTLSVGWHVPYALDSLGARRNVYNSRAKPINNGISPAR